MDFKKIITTLLIVYIYIINTVDSSNKYESVFSESFTSPNCSNETIISKVFFSHCSTFGIYTIINSTSFKLSKTDEDSRVFCKPDNKSITASLNECVQTIDGGSVIHKTYSTQSKIHLHEETGTCIEKVFLSDDCTDNYVIAHYKNNTCFSAGDGDRWSYVYCTSKVLQRKLCFDGNCENCTIVGDHEINPGCTYNQDAKVFTSFKSVYTIDNQISITNTSNKNETTSKIDKNINSNSASSSNKKLSIFYSYTLLIATTVLLFVLFI